VNFNHDEITNPSSTFHFRINGANPQKRQLLMIINDITFPLHTVGWYSSENLRD